MHPADLAVVAKSIIYWAALSLSFRVISILLMNIIAWGPQVKHYWLRGAAQ